MDSCIRGFDQVSFNDIFFTSTGRLNTNSSFPTMTEMVAPSAPQPPKKKEATGLEFLEGISVRFRSFTRPSSSSSDVVLDLIFIRQLSTNTKKKKKGVN